MVSAACDASTERSDAPRRVNLEGDLDLRSPTRRRRNSSQLEGSEMVVVYRHRALALEHLDPDRRLCELGFSGKLTRAGQMDERLSAAVEKVWLFLVGMFELRGTGGHRVSPADFPERSREMATH